jgi:hypothetical protein
MHGRKRVYASRRRAWLAIIRLWARQRRVDTLAPYACTWGSRWEDGRGHAPHIHIGHGRHLLSDRMTHVVARYTIWPLYQARRRWRQFRKGRQAS